MFNEGQSTELVGRSAIYDGPEGSYSYQNSLVTFRCGPLALPLYARAVFKRWLDIGHFTAIPCERSWTACSRAPIRASSCPLAARKRS